MRSVYLSAKGTGRRVVICGVSVTLALAVGACGSSSTKSGSGSTSIAPSSAPSTTMSSAPAAAGAKTVDVKNFMFSPMSLTVPVGTKVTWKFEDTTAHTVKADDGSFSSSPLSNGQTYSFTFTKAGTFSYICSIHPNMKATITVQ